MRLLVLGAHGFIGRCVVEAAVRHHGAASVIAGVRRGRTGAAPFPAGVEQRRVDAADEALLAAGLEGITHVIDCVMGHYAAMEFSAMLTAAAATAGRIERLVHLGSIAVFGAREGWVADDAPVGPPEDGYAAAKIAAERQVEAAIRAGRAVVLRPGLVHGPGSELWTLRIARLLAAGRLGDLGPRGTGLCNLVHVRDVADAAVAACIAPDVAGRTFNLVAPDPPEWNAYLRDFAVALDVPVKRISSLRLRVERIAAYPLHGWAMLGRRFGFEAPLAITPGLARLFASRARFDSGAASALLLPRWRDHAQAIEESARWVKGLAKA